MHRFLRERLARAGAPDVMVLYGGSVKGLVPPNVLAKMMARFGESAGK